MTIILGAVGAGIGYLAGGPAGAKLGWAIGSTVGNVMDVANNAPRTESGKLSDLRFSGSSFGAPIPICWGEGGCRVGGNVVWVETDENGDHLVQHKKTKRSGGGSGGGGAKNTSYWYTATFAVAACVGEQVFPDGTSVDRNARISKIWADDKLVYDEDSGDNLIEPTLYSGAEDQSPDSTIVSAEGLASNAIPAFRGLVYAVFVDLDLSDFSSRIPNFQFEVKTDEVTVGDIFSDVSRACGLSTFDLDVSGATTVVSGFAALGDATGQALVDSLLTCYGYDMVEVDGVLRLVERGGAVSRTIAAADMGASQDSPEGAVRYTSTRRQTLDLPGRVDVRYFDASAAHQSAVETEVRQAMTLPNVSTLDFPVSETSGFMRGVAARELDRAHVEVEDIAFSLPMAYMDVAPGDVLNLPMDTGTKRVRVVKTMLAPIGELRFVAVPDDDGVVATDQADIGGGGGEGGSQFETIVPTAFDAWSGREIVDEDEIEPGFYVVASGGANWRGCTVLYSLDDGVSWLEASPIVDKGTFGVVTSAPPDVP